MSYIAHVITEADGLGDPEVIVMTQADESGAADPIMSYSIPPGSDLDEVLTEAGWRVISLAATEPYHLYEVEPTDWVGIVRAVTRARAAAHAELRRKDTAWRHVVGDAMRTDGVPRQEIARAAGISGARAYQIRGKRR